MFCSMFYDATVLYTASFLSYKNQFFGNSKSKIGARNVNSHCSEWIRYIFSYLNKTQRGPLMLT